MKYNFLKSLNNNQIEAITTTQGPVLVIAGAGSGKTSVLTGRVGYIIQTKNINPDRILAITFTNKAADELKDRINKMISVTPEWVRTYHSTCLKILKEDIEQIKDETRNSKFIIIDEQEKATLIKDIVKQNNIITDLKNQKLIAAISYIKTQDIDINTLSTEKIKEIFILKSNNEAKNLLKVFEKYNESLKISNLLDFDDLIILTHKLLKENEQIKNKWQERFDYILVDEFQDTNLKQFEIIKWLTNSKHNNIFAVGDYNQSIYQFRGSYPKIFEDFKNSFANTKIIKLYLNYRSSQNILAAANELIENNNSLWKNELKHTNPINNDNLIYITKNPWKEAEFIINKIKDLIEFENIKYSDIAILYRNNYCSRIIEQMLVKEGIPYNIFGGINFWQRAEIKDLIAYIKMIYHPNDISCKRIINIPKRSIGETTIQNIQSWATDKEITFVEAINRVNEIESLSESSVIKIQNFIEDLREIKQDIEENGFNKMIQSIVLKTNYVEYLTNVDLNYKERTENINELIKAVEKYFKDNPNNQPIDFLEEIALYSESKKRKITNAVNLSTIHAAKGKEWQSVFIYQFNDELIPSPKCLENNPNGIEEERRIAYVAITRAKNNLFITCSQEDPWTKKSWGDPLNPSRFIKEIKTKRKIDDTKPKGFWRNWY